MIALSRKIPPKTDQAKLCLTSVIGYAINNANLPFVANNPISKLALLYFSQNYFYFIRRSQPPFLIPMVNQLMEDNYDVEFLRQHIHTLDKEFDYWMTNHTVDVDHNGQR